MSYEKRYAGIGGILDRLIWSVGRIMLGILIERPVEEIGVSIDWVLQVMREEARLGREISGWVVLFELVVD